MPHIRVLRHYIHTPYLIMSAVEAALLVLAAYLGFLTRFGELPDSTYIPTALVFSLPMLVAMMSMGVYESRTREGFLGMTLRTAVALFLLGSALVAAISFLARSIDLGRGVLLFSTIEGFVLISLWRWLSARFIVEDLLKRRVLILGTGIRARAIAGRMRRKSDRRGFVLLGFMPIGDETDEISSSGAALLPAQDDLMRFCHQYHVDEIVVAVDNRRRPDASAPQPTSHTEEINGGTERLPMQELMECRLSGIEISDIQAFIERESSKINVDLLEPSWIVFSDGFVSNPLRTFTKRCFDIFTSLVILLLSLPFMILISLAIWLTSRDKETILYRQQRVGQHSHPFQLLKFRSMHSNTGNDTVDFWTKYQDPRVTRIGRIIRLTRMDELPQLFNVLRGDMSFVGPRPELPELVLHLTDKIPYYDQRHRIKPGITGWAQLCYPYGASVEDSKEKLQYDLYYLKNHSLLLDLIILLQTVEVVLVGEGAR